MAKPIFFKNIVTYSIADILSKSILLLLSPILTRVLTPFQYGSLPLLVAIWAMISILQFGGFDFAYQMFRAQTLDEQERERIRITSTKMAGFALILLWFFFSCFALFTNFISEFAGVTKLELLFFLLAIVPSSLAYWSIFVFRFMHLSLPYVRINLLSKVVSVVVSIPFVMLAEQEHRLLVMLIVIFIAQTLSLVWVYIEYKKLKLSIYNEHSFSKDLAVKMFKFGVVFFPSSLIYSSSVYVDRMVMGYFSTVDQVAVLGLAVSLSAGVLMIKSWFSMVWDPQLLEWLATKNPKIYLPKLQSVLPIVSVLFFSLAILTKLWSQEVVELVYPQHFAEVADLIPFFVMAGGTSVLTLVAISSAIIQNTARFRTRIYTGALLVNVATAVFFIPKIGLKGAALGTLFGEVFILLSWVVVGKLVIKNLNLNWAWPMILGATSLLFILFYMPGHILMVLSLEKFVLTVMLIAIAIFLSIRHGIFSFLKSSKQDE